MLNVLKSLREIEFLILQNTFAVIQVRILDLDFGKNR